MQSTQWTIVDGIECNSEIRSYEFFIGIRRHVLFSFPVLKIYIRLLFLENILKNKKLDTILKLYNNFENNVKTVLHVFEKYIIKF